MMALKAGNVSTSVFRFVICSVLITAVVLMQTGCSNKNRVPSGILDRDEMEGVLWDIIQADRFAAQFLNKDSALNIQDEKFKMYEQIFQLHDITREEFIKSYRFYLTRPDISRVMFDSMSVRSTRQRDELYKAKDSLAKIQDSLSRAKDTLTIKTKDSTPLITPPVKPKPVPLDDARPNPMIRKPAPPPNRKVTLRRRDSVK